MEHRNRHAGLNKTVERRLTQRLILSLASSVFDPIGLVAPFTVRARLILKEIWRLHGQSWDDELPESINNKFHEWCEDLPKLGELSVPRCFFQKPPSEYELHMYGDSSQEAFSAVAFLRGKFGEQEEVSSRLAFVLGKARVAPMKALTVPKLEMQASLLAARLRSEVQAALTISISRTFMWTDSTTVLQWLNSCEKQLVFIANRVAEILDHSTLDEWFFVPTKDNPADAATRGMSADDLIGSCWLKGPDFLLSPQWPFKPNTVFKQPLKSGESDDSRDATNFCPQLVSFPASIKSKALIEWNSFSSYQKVLRIIAYVWRLHPSSECFRTTDGRIVDLVELSRSERRLHYLIQAESFHDEKRSLVKGGSVSKSSRIIAFSPFLCANGLLRSLG